jgi:multidrug efflux pump subunit AcrA (membrane-fusion protein)
MKKNMLDKARIYILFFLLAGTLFACKKKEARQIPEGTVARGLFYVDLYEEGEIRAVNSINISSPNIPWRYGNLKIAQIVKDGDEVHTGDTLIVFDPAEVRKAILDFEDRIVVSIAELEKMQAQHQSEQEELKADYEVTRISREISGMQLESAAHESEIKKREIELNLEKADIALARAKEQIDNRKKIQIEEIKQKQLAIAQDKARLQEAHETLHKLYVVTPSPGISILEHNWSSGNKFQVGDQCWSGYSMIQLPDLSKLKARININEVDIAKITTGLEVQIKPDAFSDSVFTGTVQTIANLAVNKDDKSKIKVFPVEILINETHKNLLPGLTVSCRIIIDKIENVLYLPADAVSTEGDKTYVYKKTGAGYEKTEVKTGISNSDYIIINSGLKENDKIALIDPMAQPEEKNETENEK